MARALEAAAQRSQQLAESAHDQLDQLEALLSGQVESAAEQLLVRMRSDVEQDAAQLAEQRQRLETRQAALEEQAAEVEADREETRRQRRRLADHFRDERHTRAATANRNQNDDRVRELESEREDLRRRLAEAQRQLETSGGGEDANEEITRLEQRLERALNEVKDLKKRNSDLEKRSTSSQPRAAVAADQPMDWETQKRLILEALEADEDQSPERQQERLTIDGTIRITDEVVAAKDREITDLKQLLEEQSQNVGSMAIGAAALGELLDSDEIVRQERERLQALQAEWQAKQRAAEIELSMERAKMARERAELDEKLRSIKGKEGEAAPLEDLGGGDKKAARGRWLSRLGLKEDEQ